jgi:multisubunit Na+/H+ antiporter MnhG subunit
MMEEQSSITFFGSLGVQGLNDMYNRMTKESQQDECGLFCPIYFWEEVKSVCHKDILIYRGKSKSGQYLFQ